MWLGCLGPTLLSGPHHQPFPSSKTAPEPLPSHHHIDLFCHCEERSDAAICLNPPPHSTPFPSPVVQVGLAKRNPTLLFPLEPPRQGEIATPPCGRFAMTEGWPHSSLTNCQHLQHLQRDHLLNHSPRPTLPILTGLHCNSGTTIITPSYRPILSLRGAERRGNLLQPASAFNAYPLLNHLAGSRLPHRPAGGSQ